MQKDNKRFWNRFAFIYEKVQKTGKFSDKFYLSLGCKVIKQLNSNMNVLELAMGPAILTKAIGMNCKTLRATDFYYSEEVAEQFHKDMTFYSYGIAVMASTGYLKLSDEEISNRLHQQFRPLCSIYGVPPKLVMR